MNQYRASNKTPYLLVDAGNLLFKQPIVNSSSEKEMITARAIIDAYGKMEYDAIAVGPQDLAAGISLINHPDSRALPWVSANIYNEGGTRLFPPYLSIKKGILKFAIVGLTGINRNERQGFVVADWQKELMEIIPSISASHDLIILLSTLSNRDLAIVTKRFPEIMITIGADRRKGNISGTLIHSTLLAQTAGQGKYLGQLSVVWRYRQWGDDLHKELGKLRKRQLSIRRQLAQLNKTGATGTASQKQTNVLEQKEDQISERISQLEIMINERKDGELPSSFSSVLIPLKSAIPEDPGIRDIIHSAKNRIQNLK